MKCVDSGTAHKSILKVTYHTPIFTDSKDERFPQYETGIVIMHSNSRLSRNFSLSRLSLLIPLKPILSTYFISQTISIRKC